MYKKRSWERRENRRRIIFTHRTKRKKKYEIKEGENEKKNVVGVSLCGKWLWMDLSVWSSSAKGKKKSSQYFSFLFFRFTFINNIKQNVLKKKAKRKRRSSWLWKH